MAFIGYCVLILICVAIIYALASIFLDSRNNKHGFPNAGRVCIYAIAAMFTLLVALILIAFFTHNFSLAYVVRYSNLETPALYLLTGLWAGNVGALLFPAWIISLVAAFIVWRNGKTTRDLLPNAMAIILAVEVFYIIVLFFARPFAAPIYPVTDGNGLAPMLQTPAMLIHPPTLLAGYALAVVPFAFAISALIARKIDDAWVLVTKRWLVASWVLLGVGNIVGMWWAYAVLGWGGYWAWDPIENSGFMPWLLMTALIHSNMMYLRRGICKTWTVVLAIASYWMVLFGTFLTRFVPDSFSVHTFGQSPATFVYVMVLVIILAGTLFLLFSRKESLISPKNGDPIVSASWAFSLFNALMVLAVTIILCFTFIPSLLAMLSFSNVGPVEARTFNILLLPLFLLIIFLSGIGLAIGWGSLSARGLLVKLAPSIAGGLVSLIVAVFLGWKQWNALIPVFILGFTLCSTLYAWSSDVLARMRSSQENAAIACWRNFLKRRGRYGGFIIHIAIVIMALGIVGSSCYKSEVSREVLCTGESVVLDGYTFTFTGFEIGGSEHSTGEWWETVAASFLVERDGKVVAELTPTNIWGYKINANHEISVRLIDGAAAIHSNLLRDVYIVFHNYDDHCVLVTLMIDPLVQWIWIGGYVFLFGGLISLSSLVPMARREAE